MPYQNTETVTDMVSKAGPALAVSGLTLFGISLPDLVQILTVVYLLFMLADKAYVLYLRRKHEATSKGGDELKE